jgi:hypothetical protein
MFLLLPVNFVFSSASSASSVHQSRIGGTFSKAFALHRLCQSTKALKKERSASTSMR